MDTKLKILLAEDESSLGLIIKESLENRDFEVTLCENGAIALETFYKNSFDALVLDIMMPKIDGFSVATEIRKVDKVIPILFLTSKSQTQDVVTGFKICCNDYIRKPFSMEELIVRIIALSERKLQIDKKTNFQIGKYHFNPDTQLLTHPKETFSLTNREALLLELLLKNKGEIITRETILTIVWENDDFFSGRSMDVFITRLRKKLNLDPTVQIINSRGRGYKLIG